MHVCRGNWTVDESVLLQGAYDRLSRFFDQLKVDMLALEFSTPRAGDVDLLFKNNFLKKKIALGYGVINPRIPEVEKVEDIVASVEKVLKWLPPERIWLNPDCGFATFANRPLNPYSTIEAKLKAMVEAAKILREKHPVIAEDPNQKSKDLGSSDPLFAELFAKKAAKDAAAKEAAPAPKPKKEIDWSKM